MKRSMNGDEGYQVLDLPYTPYETADTIKKRLIPYKKLVVPVRMRSVYWKYFGFPADQDGSIITKDKIVCILCKNQMINNHNTSNLRMHLTSRHKNVMAQIDPTALIMQSARSTKPRKPKAARGDEFNGVGSSKNATREVGLMLSEEGNEQDISNIAILFPNDGSEYNPMKDKEHVESNEMTDTIVNFIISDLISPDIVDGPGFHCFMSNLSSKAVVIPNEKKLVSDIIPTLFNSCKEQLYSSMQLSSINNLSLSMEEWTCANSVKCISIYVHFTQNSESILKTRLLRTISYACSETETYWTSILDRLFQEWMIDVNFVTAVIVSFTNESLLKAIKAKNLLTVPCFMFVIQQMCDEFCFHHHQVEPMLEKCRKLFKYLQDNRIEFQEENYITSDTMNSEEDEGFECFGPDRRDLWLTTYFMLKSLIHRRNAIEEAVLNLDRELIYVIPTEEEWKIMTDLVSLLEPLKTIVITLFEEKNLLISLLKPLVWKVCSSRFESSDQDSSLMQELKKQFKQTLNNAYNEQEVNNLTQIATLLDPRFKNFLQEQEDSNMDVEATLIGLLTNFVNVEGASSPKLSQEDCAPKKPLRVSGINSLLGNICAPKATLTLEDRIKAEINHYQTQNAAALEQCPLDWWCQMSNKCPNMSRLAYRYHCIPAVITHTGNYSLLEYIKIHQKRSVLNVDIADALLFLHSNRNVL